MLRVVLRVVLRMVLRVLWSSSFVIMCLAVPSHIRVILVVLNSDNRAFFQYLFELVGKVSILSDRNRFLSKSFCTKLFQHPEIHKLSWQQECQQECRKQHR